MNNGLAFYTIYDHPLDFPNAFVLRVHTATSEGTTKVSPEAVTAPTLEEIRQKVPAGLFRLPRFPEDDPKIIETWF